MTPAGDIEAGILRFHGGSLQVFGEWFGRAYDGCHRPVSVVQQPDRLVVAFDEGETLTVEQPDGVVASKIEFRVQHAERVRWECYYYGHPKTTENRFFLDYVVRGSEVVGTTNVNWYIHAFNASPKEPAVLMH